MNRAARATEVWRLMSDFVMAQVGPKARALAGEGLTPGHWRALRALDPAQPRTMGMCAEELGCDPSTATWLIDRLEEKGFVERRASATDRRVKSVVLTRKGIAMKAKLEADFYAPPGRLEALSRTDLEALDRALRALTADD
ncbi:MAG: MarR family winged helix-turn-helix transcriptional regulator [Actinomycetota bacterium]